MKPIRIFRRAGVYYAEDTATGKQKSLRTRNRDEAERLAFHQTEAGRQPHLNLQIAKSYLAATDPRLEHRTWLDVMKQLESTGSASSQVRKRWATKCKAFDSIRGKPILETKSDDFLRVLEKGGVSVNHFLRRYQNLAVGLGWLPWPILPKKLWPPIRYAPKRAITLAEHQRIIAREGNPERRIFYELLWETGASQSDAARLTSENVNWKDRLLIISRQKLAHLDPIPAQIRIGPKLETILRNLPQKGPLFPYLRKIDCKHRATEFHQRCEGLGIRGVSLHSYRYAWAVRARECGYPERFAQAALGQSSKAVHRAYARGAQVKVPSLEEYEKAEAAHTVTLEAGFSQTEKQPLKNISPARPTNALIFSDYSFPANISK